MRQIIKVKDDLTGCRFGKLTVIKQADDYIHNFSGQHIARWLCKCDCGNSKIVLSNALKSGASKSCGCSRKRGDKVKVKNSLVGQRFGKLTVLGQSEDYIEKSGEHTPMYYCLCDCGNNVKVRAGALRIGHTKSCGCYQAESLRERNTKPNTYKLFENYGICYDSTSNHSWLFDIEDYSKIHNYTWHSDDKGYARAKSLRMHRLVMGIEEANNSIVVDHINGNPSDNRKSNLRICTIIENNRNRGISKANTSGVTGVSWINREQKWTATIGLNRKLKFLGYFNSKEEAEKCRHDAEDKYFGEFSYRNSQNKAGEINDLF